MSELEALLLLFIRDTSLPLPVSEYKFHKTRKWRFDFAWVEQKVAVECEGATWAQGRHTRGSGFEKDCEKYNEAALLGWIVLRFTKGMIEDGTAIAMIKRALEEYLWIELKE